MPITVKSHNIPTFCTTAPTALSSYRVPPNSHQACSLQPTHATPHAIADTGATDHFMTASYPLDNKKPQPTNQHIRVTMPNVKNVLLVAWLVRICVSGAIPEHVTMLKINVLWNRTRDTYAY